MLKTCQCKRKRDTNNKIYIIYLYTLDSKKKKFVHNCFCFIIPTYSKAITVMHIFFSHVYW